MSSGARGRTAVVTGGMSGIGEAVVARLREDGLSVMTMDVHPSADYVVDVSDPEQVNAAAESIGSVDVLVNCAGVNTTGVYTVWETPESVWDFVMSVNLNGTFHTCRAFSPGMIARGWGRIINIASMAGKEGSLYIGAYSASKAAVIGLTKSLGKELAATGVLVNAVAPAVFETPMLVGTDPNVMQLLIDKIPMGRKGHPEEAAELVSFLASDRVTFSTGFTYDLSGGRATH